MTIISVSSNDNATGDLSCSLPQSIWRDLVACLPPQNSSNGSYSCITRPDFALKLCRFADDEAFILLHNTTFHALQLTLLVAPTTSHLLSQVDGHTELLCHQKSYKIRSRTSLLLNGGATSGNGHNANTMLTISLNPDAKLFVLRLPHKTIANTTKPHQETEETITVKYFGFSTSQSIIKNIDKIDLAPCKSHQVTTFLFGKLCEIYANIIDDTLDTPGSSVDSEDADLCESVVRKAESILKKNISSPPTLNYLVKIIGTNRNKLLKSFKSIHSMSIFEYCQRERMLLAQFMLENKSYSVAKIAESVGYKHPGNFSLAYKKHFGEPPKQTQKKSQS